MRSPWETDWLQKTKVVGNLEGYSALSVCWGDKVEEVIISS